MADVLFIFTFSPVQGFIKEARRTADLFTGSRILVDLAQASLAAIEMSGGSLVFPVTEGAERQADTPNRLVAIVPADNAANIGQVAEKALHQCWATTAAAARGRMADLGLPGLDDAAWKTIWERQTAPEYLWQCYWAAAKMESGGYKEAYERADIALATLKHSRVFTPAEELGVKDSLSGMREALHRQGERAKDYWHQVGSLPKVTGAMLREEGRERLDAIGSIKRFRPGEQSFPSTSAIAARSFLAIAQTRAAKALHEYRDALTDTLGQRFYQVDKGAEWPYDGDLLFEETLTPERLRASYNVVTDDATLIPVRAALRKLYTALDNNGPSPYYAVVVLDGDSMGELIAKRLEEPDPRAAHQAFSGKLSIFSGRVNAVAQQHMAEVIYNGGDDVLALAPAGSALKFAHALAQTFNQVTGATASAGIAIAHHLSPIDTVLEQAREAESKAKNIDGKNAVCVTLMRRGGEHTTARGRWDCTVERLEDMVSLMNGCLSSRFAYDVSSLAYSINCPGPMLQSELSRLLSRRSEGHLGEDMAKELNTWANALPGKVKELSQGLLIADQQLRRSDEDQVGQVEELSRWLLIARFLAGEGGSDDAVVS